ncbi:hypothetical protein JCM10213_000795 [Rhodosporidiobolus nylandii]
MPRRRWYHSAQPAGQAQPHSIPPAPPAVLPPPSPPDTAGTLGCDACRRVFASSGILAEHLASPQHARRLAFVQKSGSVPGGHTRCVVCSTNVFDADWQRHVASPRHHMAERYQRYQQARAQAAEGQYGVQLMPGQVDFGFVEFEAFTEQTQHANTVKELEVRTGVRACAVVKAEIGVGRPRAGRKHFSCQSFSGQPLHIQPGRSARIPIHFTPRNIIGNFDDTLVLTIYVFPPPNSPTLQGNTVVVHRTLRGQVGCRSDIEQHGPKEPYVPRAQRRAQPRAQDSDTVPAPRDADTGFKQNVPWTGRLPLYKVQPWLKELVEEHPVGVAIGALRRSLPKEATYETYTQYWQTLLQAERLQEDLDIHSYDMEGAQLQRGPNRVYFLTVPGLAEKRPSVLRGDRIRVRASSGGRWFEGAVVGVQLLTVSLRFHNSFNPGGAATFEIQFTGSSIPTRRQMQALAQPLPRKELLFPTVHARYPGRPAMHDIAAHHPFFSSAIEQNPHQREAVLSIFYRSHGKAPYVVFGPPGTGKTVTIVEAAQQLFHYMPSSVLLLTAPSNSAADILCERLQLDPSTCLRLNAPSRAQVDVAPEVRRFCFELEGTFACPPVQQLRQYRVVIATCISASILGGVGLPRGHFSHIFVDEAGQATEPQTFLPLSLAGKGTSVVLAGDPKQLGPVIRSPVAGGFGFRTSMLERLMAHPDYLDSNRAMRGVTYSKLVRNYRNHPRILELPNDLFYAGELEPRAPSSTVNQLVRWDGWPGGDGAFPVLFHAVKGRDEREGKSPSFFNVAEISIVRLYVEQLLSRSSGSRLQESDIGIIAPYNAQVKNLRVALSKPNMTVGTVEQFQGSERSAIILSTVRSNTEYLAHDKRFALGFLDNPKRFNVSLTRAQSGLIVVGDPDLLVLDPLWRRFLLYVYDNGGWAGQDWDADAYREEVDPARRAREELDDFIRQFEGLGVSEGTAVRSAEYGGTRQQE